MTSSSIRYLYVSRSALISVLVGTLLTACATTAPNPTIGEAGSANQRAEVAQADALGARDATTAAQRDAQQLQDEVTELQVKATDRGLVLTLGDVLFVSGTASLNSGHNNLNKLAEFLDKHRDRNVIIEGYTDNIGSDAYNQELSERRANAVMSYLIGQGVSDTRLSAFGKGKGSPIGDNASAAGRQQNRRVEVIIGDPVRMFDTDSDTRQRRLEWMLPFGVTRHND